MNPRPQNEERLIARVGENDPVAFEELVERHREEVLSVCRRVLGPAEAEDATQETFFAAYLAIAKDGTRPHRLRGWLHTIAHNEAVSLLRRRQVSAPMPQDVADRDSAVYGMTLRQSELRAIVDDLQRLPKDQRTALVLSEMEELSHREIAEGLKCRPEKVKALVFQARATLSSLRAAREVPCDRVRDLVTRARVGRPPAGLTRHLQACPSCAEFAREARKERRRAMLLFPFGAGIEWARSLFGAGASSAQAAAAGSGATLQGGLAKLGILAVTGGVAAGGAGAGLGGGEGEARSEVALPSPHEGARVEAADQRRPGSAVRSEQRSADRVTDIRRKSWLDGTTEPGRTNGSGGQGGEDGDLQGGPPDQVPPADLGTVSAGATPGSSPSAEVSTPPAASPASQPEGPVAGACGGAAADGPNERNAFSIAKSSDPVAERSTKEVLRTRHARGKRGDGTKSPEERNSHDRSK